MIRCCIFDLDGVIVDTAKYHYLAWNTIANELGFEFSQEDNELLKGVSRMASLDILLSTGGITNKSEKEKMLLAEKKNKIYLDYINKMGRLILIWHFFCTFQCIISIYFLSLTYLKINIKYKMCPNFCSGNI